MVVQSITDFCCARNQGSEHAMRVGQNDRTVSRAGSPCVFSLQFQEFFGRKENYEKREKLGEGSYATVYKGQSL